MIPRALIEGLEAVGVDASVDDHAELGLTSLQVVTLVDYLEQELGLMLDGTDVVREHFASKAALAALLARRGVRS